MCADTLNLEAAKALLPKSALPLLLPLPRPFQDVDPSVGYAYLSGPEELDEDARRATR